MLEAERLQGLSQEEWALEHAAREVGGLPVLMQLDASPLPDEEFDWTGIPDPVRPVVEAILERCDECAEALFDVEHRTAMRRFLARAARTDPRVFARKASPVRAAAAVAWVIATANGTVGTWSAAMSSKDLLAHFGLAGSVSDRAVTLARAAGLSDWFMASSSGLGDPGLLVSARRRGLIEARDRAVAEP
jgi:hypothetical protein